MRVRKAARPEVAGRGQYRREDMKAEIDWIPVEKGLPKTDGRWRTPFLATIEGTPNFVVTLDWENTTVRGAPVSRWKHRGTLLPSYWKVLAWAEYPMSYTKKRK